MGSGRDKRKKAKEKVLGSQPGRGTVKTEKKTLKNEEKKERRVHKALDGNEDDIDVLLAKVALEDKAKREVVIETNCSPPTARVSGTFVPHIAPKVNDIVLFGGEYTELTSGKVRVYNDLYVFHVDKRTWTRVSIPNGPAPRSAHQAVIARSCMYVFGGEFTSPNQERFYHFKDLWRLELATWTWDQITSKGGPSARSGHRMLLHKNRVLLFGGYYDTGREMRYYNDLWSLDLTNFKWTALGNMAAGSWPSPRSGCQLALHGDCMFLFGGYSKTRSDDDPELEHGKAMDDCWALDLTTYTWERVKKVGMAPGSRSSFSVVTYKDRAFLFGGTSDNEAKAGTDLSSEFHNDMYTFSMDRRRWYATEMRPSRAMSSAAGQRRHTTTTTASTLSLSEEPCTAAATYTRDGNNHELSVAAAAAAQAPSTATGAATQTGAVGSTVVDTRRSPFLSTEMQRILNAGRDTSSPIHRAAVRIQAQFRGYVVRKAYRLYRLGGSISEILYSPAAYGLDMSVVNAPKPKARIGAQVCVVGSTLWLLGGLVEVGDKEITLDDMWCVDLNKLDGWELVRENSMGEALFRQLAEEGSSGYETDDGEGDDDAAADEDAE